MKIDAVEMNADAGVVVDVAMADEGVACPLVNVNAGGHFATEHYSESRLHDALDANAVGLGMGSLDLDVGDGRHPLVLPFFGAKSGGIGGGGVRGFEDDGRPGSGNHEFGGASRTPNADRAR